jgi:hypothetical protein
MQIYSDHIFCGFPQSLRVTRVSPERRVQESIVTKSDSIEIGPNGHAINK